MKSRWLDELLIYIFISIGRRYWPRVRVFKDRSGKNVSGIKFWKEENDHHRARRS